MSLESNWGWLGSKMATLGNTMVMSDCTWGCSGSTKDSPVIDRGSSENKMDSWDCMKEMLDCKKGL